MKITVFGAGYVGLVSAACLADMGNSVMCVDVDEIRVSRLKACDMPIHEPGLEALVRRNADAGRLHFTHDPPTGVRHGTVLLIAVGTPSSADGSADLSQVLAVAQVIGHAMQDHKVVVNKSTVPVGTAELVRQVIEQTLGQRGAILPFAVISNPEFLKEGAAIHDFMHPDRVVIGSNDEQATLLMRALYAPFLRNRDRILVMDPRSAELTKYVANAMLANRISFMNEMASIAELLDADIEQVRQGVGSDPRIGTHFLYAGCGWGGSCFPKDVSALEQMGRQVGLSLPLLSAVGDVNERQKRWLGTQLIRRYGDNLCGRVFGVWGLAFKPGTDDLREAPSLTLIDQLLRCGALVQAFDPAAMPALARLWPDRDGLILCDEPMTAAAQADALVVVTEWREFRSPDFEALRLTMRSPVILDGRNLYDPATMRAHGFDHLGVGRGKAGPGWLDAVTDGSLPCAA